MNGYVAEPELQVIELPALERENVSDLTEPLNPTAANPCQICDLSSDNCCKQLWWFPEGWQGRERASLTSCSEIVFWKCKLWMVITSTFILLIVVTILSLTFHSVIYIDEDEYYDPELIASGHHHNFSGIIKIHCANPDQLLSESASNLFSEHLSKMLTDVYSDSSALGRYFISAEVIPISNENKTAASYQLCFSVPPETEDFMRYRMSREFVMNVLRQNIYDQEEMYGLVDIPGCKNMTLDPTSLSQIQVASTED